MDDLRNEIFKEESRDIAKFFERLPKTLRILIFIASYLVLFVLGLFARPLVDKLNINSNNLSLRQGGKDNVQVGKIEGAKVVNIGTASNCPVKLCSDFKDGKWQYKDRFVPIQEDPLILKSPNSPARPGATMFYDEEVDSFTMRASIIPQASQSANLVIAYGHFVRCIIGDADYSKLSCQINTAYPKDVEKWSYFDKEGELHGRNIQYQISAFVPNKELQIVFNKLKGSSGTIFSIKLNDSVPLEWKLPADYEGVTKTEKVGLGLFTTEFDDEQAVFKDFQLDPHI